MTGFEHFIEKIKKGMQEYCGEGCCVEVNEVRKNNDMIYHGITVIREGENVSPTIYIDELYQEYQEGMTLVQSLKHVIELYEKYKIDQKLDMSFLTDYEWIKNRVLYRLIGYEKNQELLKEVPHVRFLDMAVVFYCRILHDTFGSANVLLKNGLCRMWSVGAEELLLLAEKNTPRVLPKKLMDLWELTGEATAGDAQMYVLTNQQKQFGAAVILYKGVLEEFTEKLGKEFWILPSSIHEVILLSKNGMFSGDDLKKMVIEINRTQVACEDVLTDSVYYYDAGSKKIKQF